MDILNKCDIVVDVGGEYDLEKYAHFLSFRLENALITIRKVSLKPSMTLTKQSSVLLVLCVFLHL